MPLGLPQRHGCLLPDFPQRSPPPSRMFLPHPAQGKRGFRQPGAKVEGPCERLWLPTGTASQGRLRAEAGMPFGTRRKVQRSAPRD